MNKIKERVVGSLCVALALTTSGLTLRVHQPVLAEPRDHRRACRVPAWWHQNRNYLIRSGWVDRNHWSVNNPPCFPSNNPIETPGEKPEPVTIRIIGRSIRCSTCLRKAFPPLQTDNRNGKETVTLSLERGIERSNSYSASVNVDARFVSAGVGYDVTHTQQVMYGYSIPVPPGYAGMIQAFDRYEETTFVILRGDREVGRGRSYKYFRPEFSSYSRRSDNSNRESCIPNTC